MNDAPAPKRSWALRLLVFVVLVPAGLFALYVFGALHYSYSSGERSGFVQKVSLKGWLCKTWEGELAMANLPGALPEIFAFSVREEAVARQVAAYAGQRVSLTYEQHVGVPSSCFGETEYFVTAVRLVPQPAAGN